MSFRLLSDVQREGTISETLDKIKAQNREIGQHLGKSSKLMANEKAVYESRRGTLLKYKDTLKKLNGSEEFITAKKGEGLCIRARRKRGRPRKGRCIRYKDVTTY